MVIDGQHRAWGFSLASKRIRVPVIIYNDLSRAEESRIFIDINTKQSKVPNELILDIKSQAGIEPSEESILGEIFNYFSDNDDSSLKGKMAPSEKEAGKITRVTFNESIRLIIDRFEDKTPYHIYSRLNVYFGACLAHFSKLGISSNFFNPNTFKAFVALYPIVVAQTRLRKPTSSMSVDDFYDVLKIPMDNASIKAIIRGRITSYKNAVLQINKTFEASIVL